MVKLVMFLLIMLYYYTSFSNRWLLQLRVVLFALLCMTKHNYAWSMKFNTQSNKPVSETLDQLFGLGLSNEFKVNNIVFNFNLLNLLCRERVACVELSLK